MSATVVAYKDQLAHLDPTKSELTADGRGPFDSACTFASEPVSCAQDDIWELTNPGSKTR